MALNEVKPVEDIRKNWQSYLRTSYMRKNPSYGQTSQSNIWVTKPFRIKGQKPNTEKLLELIESCKFISNEAIISVEFDSRKDSEPMKLDQRPHILVKAKL